VPEDISDTDSGIDYELASLSEFALLGENAKQAGIDGALPPVERIESAAGDSLISAVRWGDDPAAVVFLHGGGQNAHTWDTVILGLGEPALAVDLPGHGRSAWRDDGDYGPRQDAATLAPVLRELAPAARLVVGMSLGGLTAIVLAATAPDLVRRLVVVDVTPSTLQRHSEMSAAQRGTTALPMGTRVFPTFAAMLDLTVAAAPHRDRESLRRGVFHNSRRLSDGTWTWRYDLFSGIGEFGDLWSDVSAVSAPTTLVRGGSSVFVTDEDAAEFTRRVPGLHVEVVPGSGHSVQSDQPRALVDLLRGVLDR
jgi:esterase